MKTTSRIIFGALIVSLTCAFESNAQLATASAIVSHHDVTHMISSAEEFAQVEATIRDLGAELHTLYSKYPNVQFTATFENNEFAGYVITGVSNSKDADRISSILSELQSLGEMANNVDNKYLRAEHKNAGRVTKRTLTAEQKTL